MKRNRTACFTRARIQRVGAIAPLLVCASLSATGATTAAAQELPSDQPETTRTLNQVTVTARFREETVQDIGGSISALDSSALESEGIEAFEDIVLRTAGLNLNDRGPNQNDVGIRGISSGVLQGLGDTGTSGPLVSQFLDDIPVAQSTASQRDFDFFDFDRVEVLRGPQPTFFGEGSVGGTIRYATSNPDLSATTISDSVLKAGVSFTKDGGTNYNVAGATSLVLVPNELAIRGAVSFRNNDGFIDNSTFGTSNINDYQSVSGRLVLLYEPSDSLSLRLMAFAGEDDVGESNAVAPPPVPANKLISNSPVDGNNTDDFQLYSAKAEYEFDSFTISSITGLYERTTDSVFYCGGCSAFGLFLPAPIGPATTLNNEDRSFTQEVRYVSDFNGPLSLIAGFYYQDTEFTSRNTTTAPGFGDYVVLPAGSDTLFEQFNFIESEQYSAFAELTYAATDHLRLIAGARYVNEEIVNTTTLSTLALGGGSTGLEPPFVLANLTDFVTAAGLENTGVFKLNKVLPRVAVEYDVSENAMLYAIVATGVRNGNLNPSSSAFFGAAGDPSRFSDIREFKEDSVVSYEIGTKTSWLDGSLTANFAGFYSVFDDIQVESSTPFVLVQNGPKLAIAGFELETTWKMNEYIDSFFSGSYQDTSFEDGFLLSPASLAAGFPFDLRKGNENSNTPRWSYSLGTNAYYPINNSDLSLTAHISYSYTGSRYSTVTNVPSSKMAPLNILNLRAGLESSDWSIVGFIRNATNDVEYTSIAGALGVPVISPSGQLDFAPNDIAINQPRTFGLEATLRF